MSMRKLIWGLLMLGLFGVQAFGFPLPVQADPTPTANFVVTPLLPKNQLSTKDGYFNLKVTPGSTQTLKLSVTNPGTTRCELQIIPVNATTADSGTIVYIPSNRTDPSAKTTFTKMTSPAVTVDLAPHQGKTVTFATKIPKSGFTGEILGGLFVTNPKTSKASTKRTAQNFQLANRYAVTTAVALWCQPNQAVPAKVQLASTKVITNDASAAPVVVAKLRNLAPIAFGELEIKTQVFEKATGHKVVSQALKNRAMAPNSWFNSEIGLGDKSLAPGKYTLKMQLASGDRHWRFVQDFTLSKVRAQEHNTRTKLGKKTATTEWYWFALAGGLAVVSGGLAYWLGRRQRHH
ncbi:DUF916 and DUF3324 domain-containing protein [Lactiplantibacillus paraxiangfangensis]|uniref:DUF916 and DUF3324 domain-containing protein n=1 Tax=Lactiplantibacillus paraxiangfangensis TaxID=3076224 RepID=UPI0030C6FF60